MSGKEKEEDIYTTLVANQDFRDWVNNPTDERDLYWSKWIESNEIHREEVDKAKETIFKFRIKEDRLSDDHLENILTKIISADKPEGNTNKFHLPKRKFSWLAIAATILAVLVASFLFKDRVKGLLSDGQEGVIAMKEVTNPTGQKSRVKLPDGSTVMLNANSSLSFPERFGKGEREVTLSGEAFFEVQSMPSTPFIVRVGQIDVEVLGTSFNVHAFPEKSDVHVALLEGKVLVKEGLKARQVTLTPGQKVRYLKAEGTFHTSDFDIVAESGWKDGILYFNDVSFEDFVSRLEQWYGVAIETENKPKDDWRVNGKFKNESLEEVLMGVQFTYKIDFEINGKNVLLTIRE